MLPEQIAVTMLVADAPELLGAQYSIGGSFASPLHGVMRLTMDADLVANLREEGIAPFVQVLGEAFYADAETMREAIGRHRSFNLVHLDARFKLGVFVARLRDSDRAQLARRQLHLLGEDPDRLLIMQAYYGERRLDHDTPLATIIYQ